MGPPPSAAPQPPHCHQPTLRPLPSCSCPRAGARGCLTGVGDVPQAADDGVVVGVWGFRDLQGESKQLRWAEPIPQPGSGVEEFAAGPLLYTMLGGSQAGIAQSRHFPRSLWEHIRVLWGHLPPGHSSALLEPTGAGGHQPREPPPAYLEEAAQDGQPARVPLGLPQGAVLGVDVDDVQLGKDRGAERGHPAEPPPHPHLARHCAGRATCPGQRWERGCTARVPEHLLQPQ